MQMRAIQEEQHGDPDVLTLSQVPLPQVKAGQVLLKIKAAGVNRADAVQRQGYYPPPPGASSIYGLEAAGRIEALGPGLDPSLLGQERVALLAAGAYADYVAVDLEHTLPLPAGVSLSQAAGLMEIAATLYSTLFLTLDLPRERSACQGKSLLIHGGSGGLGSMGIELARALGLEVFASCGSQAKCQRASQLGARAINYREENFRQVIQEATGGQGVNYIIDVVGGPYLEDNLKSLAPEGSLAILGLQGGAKGQLNLGYMLPRRLSLHTPSLRARSASYKAQVVSGVQEVIWPLVSAGQLGAHISASYRLEEAAQAHWRLESADHWGKIILEVS